MTKQSLVLPVRKCIYCLVEKRSNAFNKEHVIPRLMGRYEQGLTIKAVCADCNLHFGQHVDPVLAEDSYEAILRCQTEIQGPTAVDVLRWKRINITVPPGSWWSGARLKLAWKEGRLVVEPLPQIGFLRKSLNTYEYFTYRELFEIKDWADLSDKNFKVMSQTEEEENKLKAFCLERFGANIPFERQTEPPPGVDGEINVELFSRIDDLVKRAVCKIAFNYLAKMIGPNNHNLLLDKCFDEIREFARIARELKTNRLEVKVGNEHSILKMPPNVGVKAHLIVLETAPDGSLCCRFSPYDHFHYSVVLSENPSVKIDPVGHIFAYGGGQFKCERLDMKTPSAS